MKRSIAALALFVAGLAPAGAQSAAPPSSEGALSFPRALDRYEGEEGLSLAAVLARRIRVEPLNLVATVLFALAILHTFAASRITSWSHRLRGGHRPSPGSGAEASKDALEAEPSHALELKAELLHFLGEVEAVFGVWVIPLLAAIALARGWGTAEAFIAHGVDFTEPIFVTVVMAVASTRPVLEFAESVIGRVAALGGRTPLAWWLAVLTIAPVLGSFITEPAAMIIGALLLGRQVFERGPSRQLRYATLGLLFVNISVGGTLTHFAAPPVVMVASRWDWDSGFMLRTFGWKALIGILVASGLYVAWFRGELAALHRADAIEPTAAREAPAPAWVVAVHLGFLAWTVFVSHTPVLFIGGFLVFLAFTHATAPYQSPLNLRPALLVGFFLGGLVVHGVLQQWWIEPVLSRLPAAPLFVGSTLLTAFNDNAAITYLASLVPTFTHELRYAVVAGAVTGGGLTVIANAPNPAGQAILGRYFTDGISPLGLLAGAALPTLVMGACFLFFD